MGETWSLLVSYLFTWPGLRSLFLAQHEGYGNARREHFDPVHTKLAKTNWIYLELYNGDNNNNNNNNNDDDDDDDDNNNKFYLTRATQSGKFTEEPVALMALHKSMKD